MEMDFWRIIGAICACNHHFTRAIYVGHYLAGQWRRESWGAANFATMMTGAVVGLVTFV